MMRFNPGHGAAEVSVRRHVVIAGTGRAGTSFLVKFLTECGLETGAEDSSWSARARAGFEHSLAHEGPVPYVIKDPWLFSYCEQLDLSTMEIDALIIPIRELMLAARSRVHQERLALSEGLQRDSATVQLAAATPGGVLYSLDVVDQARILAVGFHKLLDWAVRNELSTFLLAFPRLVEDREYMLNVLWPWLGRHCSMETARAAFERVAAIDAVRFRRGTAAHRPDGVALGEAEPDPMLLERAVQRERIDELQSALSDAHARSAALEQERDQLVQQLSACGTELDLSRARADDIAVALTQAERQLALLHQTPLWRLRNRVLRHHWLAGPARYMVRLLSR